MKLNAENKMDRVPEGRTSMPLDHDGRPLLPHGHHGPIPPHVKKAMMPPFKFDKDDFVSFMDDDPDTAGAAAYIMQEAPPEIQIIAIQLIVLLLMKKNGSSILLDFNSGNDVQVKFPSPTMDEVAQKLYTDLYGEAGSRFVDILNSSPNEIGVISRMIAHLDNMEKEKL